jgi:hypothetical protein
VAVSRLQLLQGMAYTGFTAAAGIAAPARAALPAPAELVGAWQLETFSIDTGDGSAKPRFGPNPVGYLIYTPTGRMSATLMAAHRAKLPAPDGDHASRGDFNESLGNFLSYAGRYEVKGNHVFHHVEVSVFTNLVGTTLERSFTLAGDELTIRTLPPEIWGTSNRLTWRRTAR